MSVHDTLEGKVLILRNSELKGSVFMYAGYTSQIEFSKEDNIYFGKVSNTTDTILFQGNDEKELVSSFVALIDDYIQMCFEHGKYPDIPQYKHFLKSCARVVNILEAIKRYDDRKRVVRKGLGS